MIEQATHPLLIVVSAPSGAGKTTLCSKIKEDNPTIDYSVSCTTRPPRPNEKDGVSYHFLTDEAFDEKMRQGAFLEHACVHGCQYGTLRETVEKSLNAGRDVMMDIDVQGAAQIRAYVDGLPPEHLLKQAYVDIFIAPPSLEVLRSRLYGRAQDEADVIERRIAAAEKEVSQWGEYRYLVVNDNFDDACCVFQSILTAEHHRVI